MTLRDAHMGFQSKSGSSWPQQYTTEDTDLAVRSVVYQAIHTLGSLFKAMARGESSVARQAENFAEVFPPHKFPSYTKILYV